MNIPIRVTIWNEYVHEKQEPSVGALYPEGIHGALAKSLAAPDLVIRTATLEEPEHGLTQEVLNATDVLLWWGHAAHDKVDDAIVSRVQQRVWEGMGILIMHSGHMSKIFRVLNGTSSKLHWREAGDLVSSAPLSGTWACAGAPVPDSCCGLRQECPDVSSRR